MAHGEDGFPACNRVGADDGVDGFEHIADVFGGSSRSGEELEVVGVGGGFEARLSVGCCERFEKLLIGFRDAVVDLVAGCPECVCCALVITLDYQKVEFAEEEGRTYHHQSWAVVSILIMRNPMGLARM